jgi:hypothetical protein
MLKNSCGIIIFKKKNLTLQVNGTHFKFDLKNATHQPWVFFFFNSNMVYTNGFESIKQNKRVRTSKLKRSICQIAPLFLTEFNGSYLF